MSHPSMMLFQFQYGAIGGILPVTSTGSITRFQFQYGAIGGPSRFCPTNAYRISIPVWCDWWLDKARDIAGIPYFNSSMVRLVEGRRKIAEPLFIISIPVWCDWWPTATILLMLCGKFQFQYGAIGGYSNMATARKSAISIPVWCDWWLTIHLWISLFSQISIPVWCDWWSSFRIQTSFNSTFQFQYGAIGGINTRNTNP